MKKILLVEDDFVLGEGVTQELSKTYRVFWGRNQAEGLKLFERNRDIDLAILDVGLPDGSGFEIAKVLKEKSSPLFLFLTAQADAESRLKGFELGAAEYVPKPFFLKELVLRVDHVLNQHSPEKKVKLKNCEIDLVRMCIVFEKGTEFPPVNDMKVLKLLIERSPGALSRDQIINEVWGQDKDMSYRSIDNVIARLRGLIKDENETMIRSIRGVGYSWEN